MNIAEHIRDPHVIAAFNDLAMQGAAEFMFRDDGALLMSIRNKSTEEVLFKVTRTGLYCLARFENLREVSSSTYFNGREIFLIDGLPESTSRDSAETMGSGTGKWRAC